MWRKTVAHVQQGTLFRNSLKLDEACAQESLVDNAACAAAVHEATPRTRPAEHPVVAGTFEADRARVRCISESWYSHELEEEVLGNVRRLVAVADAAAAWAADEELEAAAAARRAAWVQAVNALTAQKAVGQGQATELKGTTRRLEALFEECTRDNHRLRTALACRAAENEQMVQQLVDLRHRYSSLQASVASQGGQSARNQQPVDQTQAPPTADSDTEAATQDGAATSHGSRHAHSLGKQAEHANEAAVRLRGQLKAEQKAHDETKAAFVAEVAASNALLHLLHSVEACLRRRLAASSGCSAPLQPAAGVSTALSLPQRLRDAPGAVGCHLTPVQCICSSVAVQLEPSSSQVAAELGSSRGTDRQRRTPRDLPDGVGALTPGSCGMRISTPRRYGVPMRISRSAHELRHFTSRGQACNGHAPADWTPTKAARATAALAALCGVSDGSGHLQADGSCAAAACAARLQVVHWLAGHAFGAERMTAMQACQQVVDQV